MKKIKKKLTQENKQIEGSFLDIVPPQFEWIKLNLVHFQNKWLDENGVLDHTDDDFTLSLNMSEKMTTEDKEFSLLFKEATKMPWVSYFWKDKEYKYYTTKYSGDLENRKNILNNIIKIAQEFEVKKKLDWSSSNVIFNDDVKNNVSYNMNDYAMKYCEELKSFVLIAKGFLGSDKYGAFRSSSKAVIKFNPEAPEFTDYKDILTTDFFKEFKVAKLQDKTIFLINESNYENIRNIFLSEQIQKDNFIAEQNKILEKGIDFDAIEVKEDNLFKLRIEFDPDRKCFLFSCKGYSSILNPFTGYGGNHNKSVLSILAANYIYSKEDRSDELINSMNQVPVDYKTGLLSNKEFIELETIQTKEKNIGAFLIPLTQVEKLKTIKENYEKMKPLWFSEDKKIKIKNVYVPQLRNLAVYFDKGKSFLVYTARDSGGVLGIETMKNNKKVKSYTSTLYSKEITYEQAMHYLNTHDMHTQINNESKMLNTIIASSKAYNELQETEKDEIYNKVLLVAKLEYENPSKNTKKQKMKI